MVAESMLYMEKVDGSMAAGAKNMPLEKASSTARNVAAAGLQCFCVALRSVERSRLGEWMDMHCSWEERGDRSDLIRRASSAHDSAARQLLTA